MKSCVKQWGTSPLTFSTKSGYVKDPSCTHPPPERPVRLKGFCSGVEGTKGPLPPNPRVGEKTGEVQTEALLMLKGDTSSDQFQYL